MRIDTVSLIISAFVTLSLGAAALMRNFRNRLYLAFAVLAVLLAAHNGVRLVAGFGEGSPTAFYKILVFLNLSVGLSAFWLLWELFPGFTERVRRVLWGYSLLALILAVAVFFPDRGDYYRVMKDMSDGLLLIPAFFAARWFEQASRLQTLPRERLRYRQALGGLVGVVFLYLSDALYYPGIATIPPLGALAVAIYLIFLFQIFIQREFLTLSEIVSRIFLFGGIALVLTGIYSLLVSWVGAQPGLFFFNSLIASFVILVLFDPIRSSISRLMRKVFLQRNAALEEELEKLAQELRGSLEPNDLRKALGTALERVLGISNPQLFILERDSISYLKVGVGEVVEVLASDPLVEYMTLRRGRPFVSESLESDLESFHSSQGRKFCQDCLSTLRTLGSDFVIPFFYEGTITGFLACPLGEKIILSNEQLRSFAPVARQIAFLLKNGQVLSVLRDRDKLLAVGEMAAGLAHEIKNPLGAIKGAAELLQEEKDPERTKEYLTIIQDEAMRLSGVLTEFLDYARPRRKAPESSCDALKVIDHTAALVLRDSKVKWEVDCDAKEILMRTDPEILKQILLNLMLNSVQAMAGQEDARLCLVVRELKSKGGWHLGLPLYKVWEGWRNPETARSAGYVEIQIQDNGPGIDPKDRERVFVPFYTTKPKGTGLGLAICQRLVESLKGSIHIRSHYPKGTTFVLHLPIGDGGDEPAPEGSFQSGFQGAPA